MSDLSRKIIYVWKGMWLAITKTIWIHKNKVIFEDGQVDEIEIFTLAQFYGLKRWESFAEW